VIGTLVHGTGTISRSFLDKVASNYRANADGEIAVRRTRQHGNTFSSADQSLIQTSKIFPDTLRRLAAKPVTAFDRFRT
jgi:hypothetical protein